MPDKTPSGAEAAVERFKEYLGRIATGPKQSKDLTEAEAAEALACILNGEVSPVRAGIFLVAARLKRETLEENIGYWRALDGATVKREVNLDNLLQIADPFDGFHRVPYFGFYAIPVLAALGLPSYGHSALPLPPKCGITFEEILRARYRANPGATLERRAELVEKHQFGYVGLQQSHPALEGLRELRREMIKRTALSTFEKMLMPLRAKPGGNFLATGYFHKGYEVPMLAVAKLSGFDRTIAGNGAESTALYGVHAAARVYIDSSAGSGPEERKWTLAEMFSPAAAQKISAAYEELKTAEVRLDQVAAAGEAALQSNRGSAAPLIACQAAVLRHLADPAVRTAQAEFDAAEEILRQGVCYEKLMRYVEDAGR